MDVRLAKLEEILPLREAVIIAGTDRESPYFAGDFDAPTKHVGVFDGNTCVGCASFMRSEYDDGPAWQLRGMATAPDRRREGIGRALLAYAERELFRDSPIQTLWCNARTESVAFYERVGWKVVSDEFVIEGVGAHRKMMRRLP